MQVCRWPRRPDTDIAARKGSGVVGGAAGCVDNEAGIYGGCAIPGAGAFDIHSDFVNRSRARRVKHIMQHAGVRRCLRRRVIGF